MRSHKQGSRGFLLINSLKVKLGFVSQLHVQNNAAFLFGAVLPPPSPVDFAALPKAEMLAETVWETRALPRMGLILQNSVSFAFGIECWALLNGEAPGPSSF